jgi:nucleotide-binding universal stress UspA family protein
MSPTTTPGPVVVGVDFSKVNAAAVDYATAVAARRQLPVEFVYAIDPQSAPPTYLAMTMHELTEQAESDLTELADTVRREHPSLEVTTHVLAQSPTEALVEASQRASMVVLGSRGHGGFAQLLLGSEAWRVTSRAAGPVVLVRPGGSVGKVASGPVLVGVDDSENSLKAMAFAFQEASSRGTGLIAVTVWSLPQPDGLAVGRDWPADADDWMSEMESDAERILSEALAGAGEQHPDVTVSKVVVHGFNIPQALLETASANGADLIVVGARGTHAFAELVLGAVGVQLSQHADRSVAVVHG